MKTALFCSIAVLVAGAAASPAQEETSVFGSAKRSDEALLGIFYDLKQTQEGEKLPINHGVYHDIVNEFLSKDWDESVLDKYFRATRPLYATQVFIPLMEAGAAPKAFGVEKVVEPRYWLIHYKGQVTVPEDGEWRFWGNGEEVCSVAVDGKIVLLANWREVKTPDVPWTSPEPPGLKVASSQMRAGDWMKLKKGQVIDLDVLIGERGGGVFCAFLLMQKKGQTYEMRDGFPVLPVFQLAPFDTPQPPSTKKGPPIAAKGPIWRAIP